MHIIKARNVHAALPEAVRHLLRVGVPQESRNGPVLVAPSPVATVYEHSRERVEAWPERDSNPVFHLMEAMWMLAGRNDVAFPSEFNSTFGQFSDDGVTFNGAYGHRWRSHFGRDQLREIGATLARNPQDRRQVLSMWDARLDLELGSKDVPCNTQAFVSVSHEGKLDLTVCCRSNDIVWGCYGSNAVHFSILQEYLAARVGVPVGTYTHVSHNWHGYTATLGKVTPLATLVDHPMVRAPNPYADGHWPTADKIPLMFPKNISMDDFDRELCALLEEGPEMIGVKSVFLRRTICPLWKAYRVFKDASNPNRHDDATEIAHKSQAQDWRDATMTWLQRRKDRVGQTTGGAKSE